MKKNDFFQGIFDQFGSWPGIKRVFQKSSCELLIIFKLSKTKTNSGQV